MFLIHFSWNLRWYSKNGASPEDFGTTNNTKVCDTFTFWSSTSKPVSCT